MNIFGEHGNHHFLPIAHGTEAENHENVHLSWLPVICDGPNAWLKSVCGVARPWPMGDERRQYRPSFDYSLLDVACMPPLTFLPLGYFFDLDILESV